MDILAGPIQTWGPAFAPLFKKNDKTSLKKSLKNERKSRLVASKFHVFFEIGFRIDFLKKNRSLGLRFGGQMAIKTLPKSHHKITEILIDFLMVFGR